MLIKIAVSFNNETKVEDITIFPHVYKPIKTAISCKIPYAISYRLTVSSGTISPEWTPHDLQLISVIPIQMFVVKFNEVTDWIEIN
jgi:hypothetical protein